MGGLSTFVQLLLRSLETGSVYALAALGIIIIFRTSFITHFAQGVMGMFNTFVVVTLLGAFSLPLWVAVLCGVISAVVTGFLVDFIIIRRARKVTLVGRQIITLGLILIFVGLAPMIFGVDPLVMPRFIPTGMFTIPGLDASISHNAVLNISLGLVLMGALFFVLQRTKLGLAVRTTASNEPTARLMGVPTRMITLLAWAVAAVLGMLSGIMIAPATTVTPTLMNVVQVNALMACVLGGFQTFYGPVIAAYILAIGANMLLFYASHIWGVQIMYLLVLLFLVVRPNGLIGKKIVKKV